MKGQPLSNKSFLMRRKEGKKNYVFLCETNLTARIMAVSWESHCCHHLKVSDTVFPFVTSLEFYGKRGESIKCGINLHGMSLLSFVPLVHNFLCFHCSEVSVGSLFCFGPLNLIALKSSTVQIFTCLGEAELAVPSYHTNSHTTE